MVKKIALEEHFLCPEFIDYWNPTVAGMPAAKRENLLNRNTDFGEMRLASMDAAGISRAVLGLAGPGVQQESDVATAIRNAKSGNDFLAKEIQKPNSTHELSQNPRCETATLSLSWAYPAPIAAIQMASAANIILRIVLLPRAPPLNRLLYAAGYCPIGHGETIAGDAADCGTKSPVVRCSNYFSSTIRVRSTPIPVISTSSTSPGFIQSGGLRLCPTPSGVPVAITSPGCRVVKSEQKLTICWQE